MLNNKLTIQKIRQSRTFKGLALFLVMSILTEIFTPTVSLALTEGPSQPEVQSFEPISTTEMVDLFSGDFNYNIPLFNLPGPNGGYPMNLAYHAGVSTDDEASWVGLGWNINPGALVRNMRGLPDEFLSSVDEKGNYSGGDFVETKTDMRKSWTLGASFGAEAEIFGGQLFDNQTASLSVFYNNYSGVNASVNYNFSNQDGGFDWGLSLDGENGVGLNAGVSLKDEIRDVNAKHHLSVSFDGNLSANYSLNANLNENTISSDKSTISSVSNSFSYGSGISYARENYYLNVGNRKTAYNINFNFSKAANAYGSFAGKQVGAFFNVEDLLNEEKTGYKNPVAGYAELSNMTSNREKYYSLDYSRISDGMLRKNSILLAQPSYNSDAYVSTGQGLSGFFRGKRNDVGKVYDQYVRNTSWGLTVGLELKDPITVGTIEYLEIPIPPYFIPVFNSVTSNHVGLDASLSFGWNTQGPWDGELNELSFNFKKQGLGIEEIHYLQAHGEPTITSSSDYAHMDGLDLAFVRFSTKDADNLSGGKRRIEDEFNPNLKDKREQNDKRQVRNTLIHTLKNSEVSRLGEFNVKYYDFSNSLNLCDLSNVGQSLNRSSRADGRSISHHPAGYKVLNQEGSYYVYGLPAYNNKEISNVFSADFDINSDEVQTSDFNKEFVGYNLDNSTNDVDYQFDGGRIDNVINKSSKSPYAHSYLLTSVQGADYVDVKNDGPTDDDLGYWVKFDYIKKSDAFKWRAPMTNATANIGKSYTVRDDKGSYSYGEKELWYVGRIETKTHIAIFDLSEREDGIGADSEHDNSSTITTSERLLKLDKIRIFEKKELSNSNPKPLQTIKFSYEYSRCQGVPNKISGSTGIGKLTLKSIHFLSNNSKRERNKYTFDYDYTQVPGSNPLNINENTAYELANPNYKTNSQDPWGTYRPKDETNFEFQKNFPYSMQFDQRTNGSNIWNEDWMPFSGLTSNQQTILNKKIFKEATDLKASAWCLRKITLPSGGQINIDYESDDYGYVQHKTANQMFKIDHFSVFEDKKDVLFEAYENTDYSNSDRRKVYFKLENPIPTTSNVNETVYNDYVKPLIQDEAGRRHIYIKTKIELTQKATEYISGYLELENWNPGIPQLFGAENIEMIDIPDDGLGAVNCYTMGYVTLQKARKPRKDNEFYENYHPLAVLAWNYMQAEASDLLSNPSSFENFEPGGASMSSFLGSIVDVLNVIPGTAANFGAIKPYCKSKQFGRKVRLDYSCMRLASPDKIKFGGGHRVSKITITDNWTADSGTNDTRTYGQVFDYTINENGKVISSGVAAYEPQLGGDENALKYPIHFSDKTNLVSSNRLFVEGPVNENLFPGATVGYRKVTVKSLNTESQLKNIPEDRKGRVGGVSVHEFYTAKEFPTFVDYSQLSEENSTKDVFNVPIPIPLIGMIKRNYFHGAQAFKIELNDMHGKPKSVKTYEINNYSVGADPITEASYEYQLKSRVYQGENVFELDNQVKVIRDDDTHSEYLSSTDKKYMGVEAELFTDQRETKSFNNSAGLGFNVDMPVPLAFLPTIWPSYSNSKSMTRTYVTNKVIHKSGILKKTKTRDLQTVNESEIIAYDEKSGIPLLSRIKNEFGDDFYSYNIPAYYEYNGMGHAYQNINYTFAKLDLYKQNPTDDKSQPYFEFDASEEDLKYLIRGDELLTLNSKPENQFKKLYFLGWRYTNSSPSGVRGMLGTCYGDIFNVDGENLGNIETQIITHTWFKVIRSGHRNQFGVSIANYLTKGKISENAPTQHILENADGVQISTPKIENNVLSATASLYRDDWNQSIYGLTGSNITTNNPFLSGNSGIWRPYKSYTYVGERSSNQSMNNNTDADAKLYEDGVMSNVPMFSWELGNMENYVSNWEWVSEVTRYSPDAYELENVNRIGVYSSALYGYNNSLSIGVGSNAAYNEIGTMDFEFLPTDANSSFRKVLNQTNLNFAANIDIATNVIFEHFNIISSLPITTGSEITVKTTIPFDDYDSQLYGTKVGLVLHNKKLTNGSLAKTASIYVNADVTDYFPYTVGGVQYTEMKVATFLQGNAATSDQYFPTGARVYGKISLPITRALAEESKAVSYASNKAHTGKKSMKVNAESLFEQVNIKLVAGKKYIYSMWISRDNDAVRTFEDGNNLFELGFMSGGVSTYTVLTPLSVKYSKVIEGWQKVDVEFIATNSSNVLGVKFKSAGLYVDDIRISPKTGGLATYVYNPINYWLNATLNANNYATFYYYDEEGNLHLKKQETEEGIFTITESRGYVPNNN